jgi:hypothetical protein
MQDTKERLDDIGLEVLDVELFRMDPKLEPENFSAELDATAALGATNIIAQLPDPNFERKTERFARLCDLAKPLGIFVSLEFPHWTETGSRRRDRFCARQSIERAMLIDGLHMGRLTGRRTCASFRASVPLRARLRRRQQVPTTWEGSSEPGARRGYSRRRDARRRGILACLPDDIPYSLEIPRAALTKAVGPEEVARLAIRVAQNLLDERPTRARARAPLAATPAYEAPT